MWFQRSFKAVYYLLAGAVGGLLGDLPTEIIPSDNAYLGWLQANSGPPLLLIFDSGLWFAFIGAFVSMFILLSQSWYQRRFSFSLATLTGTLSGFVVAMFAGAIAQTIFNSPGHTEVLRVLCWGLAGCLLGASLSFQILNLGLWRGALGGLIGGLIGGVLFVLINFLVNDDMVARIIGVSGIGAAIGLMVGLAEGFLQPYWLEVRFGGVQTRLVNLGASWVPVGGDRTRSVIFIEGLPAIVCRYRISNGFVNREDMATHSSKIVEVGDTYRLKNTSIIIRGRNSAKRVPPRVLAKIAMKAPRR